MRHRERQHLKEERLIVLAAVDLPDCRLRVSSTSWASVSLMGFGLFNVEQVLYLIRRKLLTI